MDVTRSEVAYGDRALAKIVRLGWIMKGVCSLET
jgi:hypothetical protein